MKDKAFKKRWKAMSIWGKIWHIISVIFSITLVLAMALGVMYILGIIFLMGAAVLQVKDLVLLDLIHWIFG